MARDLLLIPTEFERKHLQLSATHAFDVETCGFGLMEAAVRTSRLIQHYRPTRVLLAGIAGVYSPFSDRIGTAAVFPEVAQYGIGIFHDGRFQFPESESFAESSSCSRLSLAVPEAVEPNSRPTGGLLVTVASGRWFEEKKILAFFADQQAGSSGVVPMGEDMEGFAVARICAESNVPCTIVRGFSNHVGDPDPSNWRVGEAMESTRQLVTSIFNDAAKQR